MISESAPGHVICMQPYLALPCLASPHLTSHLFYSSLCLFCSAAEVQSPTISSISGEQSRRQFVVCDSLTKKINFFWLSLPLRRICIRGLSNIKGLSSPVGDAQLDDFLCWFIYYHNSKPKPFLFCLQFDLYPLTTQNKTPTNNFLQRFDNHG